MSVPETALLLAAGFGTRLRPITNTTPKALVEIGGRPMIEYPIRMLARSGVRRFVVNLHHLGDAIRARLRDGSELGVTIEYSPEDPILDTGGAIRRARPMLGDAPFLVANCDAFLDADVPALCATHEATGALATLLVRADPEADRYGAVELDTHGRVRRFLGKPNRVDEPLRTFMFCGVHVVSSEIHDWMPDRQVFSITRDVYAAALASSQPLFGSPYEGYWRDLGTPEALDAARADLATGAFRPSYVS